MTISDINCVNFTGTCQNKQCACFSDIYFPISHSLVRGEMLRADWTELSTPSKIKLQLHEKISLSKCPAYKVHCFIKITVIGARIVVRKTRRVPLLTRVWGHQTKWEMSWVIISRLTDQPAFPFRIKPFGVNCLSDRLALKTKLKVQSERQSEKLRKTFKYRKALVWM